MQPDSLRMKSTLSDTSLKSEKKEGAVSFGDDYHAPLRGLDKKISKGHLCTRMKMDLWLLKIDKLTRFRREKGHHDRKTLRNPEADISDID